MITLEPKTEIFVNKIVEEVISDLPNESLNTIIGGYENDIHLFLDNLKKEITDVFFGNRLTQNFSQITQLDYIEKFTESVEETLIKQNLLYFLTNVYKDFIIGEHHIHWAELVHTVRWLNIIAARDHGKSFFFSNAYPIWRALSYDKNNKADDRSVMSKEGFLFSFSSKQAIKLLGILKETVEDNDYLRERLYPGKSDGWGATEVKFKNGAKLITASMGGSTRGSHPKYIVCDDILKDNVMYSREQREKYTNFFHSVIMNMIVPRGQVIVVGTPFHKEDLYGDLKKKKGWIVREYPSIFPDGSVLWKGRYTLQDLLDKRDSSGSLNFSREHLCRPITNESSIFPYEFLKRSINDNLCMVFSRENYAVKLKNIAIGCDFAISANVGADYTVFTVVGMDLENRIHVLNVTRMHGKSYNEQVTKLRELNLNFKPNIIYAENNAFQQIFVQNLQNEMPIKPHTTNGNKKDFNKGLPNLSVQFELFKIIFPSGDEYSRNMRDLVFSELGSIAYTDNGLKSVGGHDDTAMSLWIATLAIENRSESLGFAMI